MGGREGGKAAGAASTAGAGDSLVEHLQLKILEVMNTKSLIRLQLVCKSWHSFISEQHLLQPVGFFYNPLRLSPATSPSDNEAESLTIFNRRLNVKPVFNEALGFVPGPFRDFRLADCLDGVLLFHQTGNTFFVCNPVTEKFVAVPVPYFAPAHGPFPSFLAFHFSAAGDRFFKILSFVKGHIYIYSSLNRRWDEPVPLLWDAWGTFSNIKARAAFSKGSLYVAGCSYILRIGVSKGSQKIIPLPDGSEFPAAAEGTHARTIDRLLGILANRVCYAEMDDLLLRVWVLEERTGKWDLRLKTKIYNKRLKSTAQILGFHPHLPFVFFHTGRVVVAFDLKAKNLEMVSALGTDKIKVKEAIAFPFFPSYRCFGL